MLNATPLLYAQLIATCSMFGVIWFVQLVTYPQFAEITPLNFPDYHAGYSKRITLLVAPLMIAELAASAGCLWIFWNSPLRWVALAGFILVVALWAVTALVQVPQHEKLSLGHDREVIASLVAGNRVRVILWTCRIPVALILLRNSPQV